MRSSISTAIRKFVASRANFRCEYCKKPEIIANFPFHIEHIISRQHQGSNQVDNLAYAFSWCNLKKGPNIATLLCEGGKLLPLFNPRKDVWEQHFSIKEGVIRGKTDIGKGTVQLLEMNTIELILERKALMDAGFL